MAVNEMMMMAMLLTLLAALCPSISGGGQPPMCVAVVVNVCFTAAAAAAAAAASTACVSVSNVDQLYVLSVHLGVRSVAEIWTGIEQPPASDKPSTPLARSLRATYAAAGPRHQGSVSLLVGTPIDDAVLHLVRCVSVCLSVSNDSSTCRAADSDTTRLTARGTAVIVLSICSPRDHH